VLRSPRKCRCGPLSGDLNGGAGPPSRRARLRVQFSPSAPVGERSGAGRNARRAGRNRVGPRLQQTRSGSLDAGGILLRAAEHAPIRADNDRDRLPLGDVCGRAAYRAPRRESARARARGPASCWTNRTGRLTEWRHRGAAKARGRFQTPDLRSLAM